MSETLFDYAAKYPDHPGAKARDTSFEAADKAALNAKQKRRQVYEVLKMGPKTADEVASYLGWSVLSARPRLSELASRSKIKDTGERRRNDSGRNAIVWAAV